MRAARPIVPWLVWGVSAMVYAIAIINRSTLAALGPATQDHFGIDATTLATFPVIQLLVYAVFQIPVGILLDRFGSTALILVGGALMIVGQLVMATVADVWLAILARVLVGAGDACTFISVMRILPEWFAVRQLPTITQVTTLIGQGGQLVSVTPFAIAVSAFGWTAGFVGVAAVGLLVAILGAVVLRDYPGQGTALERMTGRIGRASREARSLAADRPVTTTLMAPPTTEAIMVQRRLSPTEKARDRGLGFWTKTRMLLSIPGVRLSFWLHFGPPFATNTFVLLWGTPFLTGGLGFSREAAGALLSLVVVASMLAGLLLGPLSSRFLEKRVWINFGVTVAIALSWIAVLVWQGAPPLWLVVVLLVVMPIGGPTAMIAFEVLRSHTPRSLSGFATGLVNTAGFTSSLLVILLIGFVLDLQGAGSPEDYSLTAFEWAFAVQIPFWLLGLAMIVLEFRRTSRWMVRNNRRLR